MLNISRYSAILELNLFVILIDHFLNLLLFNSFFVFFVFTVLNFKPMNNLSENVINILVGLGACLVKNDSVGPSVAVGKVDLSLVGQV